jgi:hypothetical protein
MTPGPENARDYAVSGMRLCQHFFKFAAGGSLAPPNWVVVSAQRAGGFFLSQNREPERAIGHLLVSVAFGYGRVAGESYLNQTVPHRFDDGFRSGMDL